MATQTATLAALSWQNYAANSKDLIAPVLVDLSTYASVTVTPTGAAVGVASQIQSADGVVVDNMQGTSDLMVQIGPVLELVPRYQKTVIPLYANSPPVIFSGAGTIPRVYFYVGTFRGVGNNLNAFASNQAANVASITGGTVDAYLQTLRWKFTYQLSAGFNLDNIIDSGFYDVLNPVNSGTSLGPGTWFIESHIYSQSPLFIVQRARNLISNDTQFFERRSVVGVWSPWRNVGTRITGQCRFIYTNATTCTLVPIGGGLLNVAGNIEQIPAGGLAFPNTIGATTLNASTLYFAYVYMSAPGVMAYEWSTTAFALDTRGIAIKSGDPSRSLVGMIYTMTDKTFRDSDLYKFVASYYNRRRAFAFGQQGSAAQTASTTPLLVLSVYTLNWGDEPLLCQGMGHAGNSTNGAACFLACGINSTSTSGQSTAFTGASANQRIPLVARSQLYLPIGTTYASVFIWVSTGTGTWDGLGVYAESFQ